MSDIKLIINEVSGYPVTCGKCRKHHFGRQTYNDLAKDYICDECDTLKKENK